MHSCLDRIPAGDVLHGMLNKYRTCLRSDLSTCLCVIASKDHLGTLLGHAINGGFADAIRAAGNQGHFVS